MTDQTKLPRVVLKKRKALPFFSHHPWVFAGAIHHIEGEPDVGDEVLVVADDGTPIARGLFNAKSQIQVRLYSWDVDQPLDRDFWRKQIQRAINLRSHIFDEQTQQACRLIFSEGDGISGLTVDRYADWLVIQLTSAALSRHQEIIIEILQELTAPTGIWLRTEKGMAEAEGLEIRDGLISGTEPPRPIWISENGIEYAVDIVEGQKTGFYYDQRDNRRVAAEYLCGQVLDVCSYTGGFALNGLIHGKADQVTTVDSSHHAVEMIQINAERNTVSDRLEIVRQDGLNYLEQCEQQFDGIVLDPPKFARSRGGIQRALKAYLKWNRAAMKLVKPGGVLVTCSCSGLVGLHEFEQVVAKSALEAKREVQILESRSQAADHPVSLHCLESRYLKCLICAVN